MLNFSNEISIEHNQPGADLSVKYFFKSNFTKPEIYVTFLVIGIIVALFSLPVSFPIALSTSITLAVLTVIFDIGMLLTRSLLIPSGGYLGRASFINDAQNAAITLSDGTILRGSWNKNNADTAQTTLLIVFGGNGQTASFSTHNDLTGYKIEKYKQLNWILSNYYKENKADQINRLIQHIAYFYRENINKDRADEIISEYESGKLELQAKNIFDRIQMNYRGTSNSDGLFGSHLQHVKDGIEIVAAAKNLGYKKIKIVGHSLGGSIAPHVKAYFDEKQEQELVDIYLFNTFHRLDEILSCQIENPIIKAISKLVLKFFLICIGWNYRYTLEDWDKLKGQKIAFGGGTCDVVIPPSIELAKMLKSHGKKEDQARVSFHDHNNFEPLAYLLHPEGTHPFPS